MKKLTVQNFIDRSNIIHNNVYDYSVTDFVNTRTKVEIRYKTHNIVFNQVPADDWTRERIIRNNGYNLISIRESEYNV